jgi:hypothetical protein
MSPGVVIRAIDCDRWLIIDARTNAAVGGTDGTPRHGMTLEAVEAYLTGNEWTFATGALDDVLVLQHDVAEENAGRTGRRSKSRGPQRAASDGPPPTVGSQLYRAARLNPGRPIRKEDLSTVRHDRLLLAERKCAAAGGAIVGGLRRSRPDERESGGVHACD